MENRWVYSTTICATLREREAGTNALLVRNEANGCTATESVEVKEEFVQVTLPTQVEIQQGQEQIETIQIYNRWREIIFFGKGYGVPWDGYYKNQLVANGVHPYVLQVNGYTYLGAMRVMY